MNHKNVNQKTCPVLVILLLVLSGLQLTIPFESIICPVNAASSWTQTSNTEFIEGVFSNVSIFGSGSAAELRLKDQHNWTDMNPLTKPVNRYSHAMAAVYGTDNVVLFGGRDSSGFKDDTWEYDFSNNTWTLRTPSRKPTPRYQHTMASIYGDDKVLLFGGYVSGMGYVDDTWVYDLSSITWSNMNPTGNKPGPLNRPAMASIYGDDKVVLFGGLSSGFGNDTWVYDLSNNSWTTMNPLGNVPNGRYYHAMASIHGDDKVLLYGGRDSTNWYDKTWIYDLSDNAWVSKNPSSKPGKIYNHNMASIYRTDKIVLFGGIYSVYLDNTWVYDLSDNIWIEKLPQNKPIARAYHSMASIYGTDYVMVFGGYGSGYRDDTWTYCLMAYTYTGTFNSPPYDLGTYSTFNKISWNGSTEINTSIKFQLRSAANESALNNETFVGPNGNKLNYYTSSPSNIWLGHYGDRWIQYRVYLYTTNKNETPRLMDVTISYNRWCTTKLVSPANGSLLSSNIPTFVWNFTDYDSDQQTFFQVQIANNSAFENIIYDSGLQSSANQQWQFPSGTSYTELPDSTWYWKVRTKDNEGDWGLYSSPWKIVIDTQIPNSVPTIPINNGYYNNLNTISGIAYDTMDGSGINKVEIAIQQISNDYYWDGVAWAPEESWLLTFGTTTWSYDSSQVAWTSGNQYNITSRAMDNATNIELPGCCNVFIFDGDAPLSAINIPKNNSFLNNLATISGSAMDFGGSGIDKVEITIKRMKDNYYWDGMVWSSIETWLHASELESWSYDSSITPWSSDFQYIIRSRASDKVGNIELLGVGNTFMFDDQPPKDLSIVINNGARYTNSTSAILSLHSIDTGSDMIEMSFSINGTIWSPWEKFKTTKSYDLTMGDGEKIVYFRAQDRVGNIAEAVFDTIILDTTPPENLSIVINQDAKYTTSKLIYLNLMAIDTLSGLKDMAFSTDSVIWTTWESFTHDKSLILPFGDGEKIIYFRVMDNAGNTAQAFDTIILDITPPHSLSILINNGTPKTNSTTVTLDINAIDDTSGVYQMSFSTDKMSWSDWEMFNYKWSLPLLPNDGEKAIYFRVNDRAGNIANPVLTTIFLNPPSQKMDSDNNNESEDKDNLESKKTTTPLDKMGNRTFSLMLIIIILTIILLIIVVAIISRKKNQEQQTNDQYLFEQEPDTQVTYYVKQAAVPPPVLTMDQRSTHLSNKSRVELEAPQTLLPSIPKHIAPEQVQQLPPHQPR